MLSQDEKNKKIERMRNIYGDIYLDYLGMKFVNFKFQNINVHDDIDKSFNTGISMDINDSNKSITDSYRKDIYIKPDYSNVLKTIICSINKTHEDDDFKGLNLLDNKFQKIIYKSNDSDTEFYISLNEHIEFETNNKKTTFSLIRMKVNFLAEAITRNNVKKIIKIPGELIDISIAKYSDNKSSALKNKIISDLYSEYTYKSIIDEKKTFKFYSYNLHSFIHDIYAILFDDGLAPWLGNKYNKRIYRLFLLISINLFTDLSFQDKKKQPRLKFQGNIDIITHTITIIDGYLDTLQNNFDITLDNITLETLFEQTKNNILIQMDIIDYIIDDIIVDLDKLGNDNLELGNFFKYYRQMINNFFTTDINNIRKSNLLFNDKFFEEIKKFNNLISDNLIIIKNFMQKYCDFYYGERKLNLDKLKQLNILGGEQRKYLKYKSKNTNF
jgi:hypothetical protein